MVQTFPVRTLALSATAIAAALVLCVAAAGAQDAGTIASFDGTVDVGRNGAWTPAAVGAAVRVGETVRTGAAGRALLVFRDESVLTIAPNTELVITEQIFEPERGVFRSLLHVARGKVKALVSEYYHQPKASYEIETTTAVAGVRGTEFVIVFDPVAEVTAVAGVSGTAEVHSVLDRVRRGVLVNGQELTTVARGRFPAPPTPLDETLFRQYLEGLEFTGAKSDSLTSAQAALSGGAVAPGDRVAAFPVPPAPAAAAPMGGGGGAAFEGKDAATVIGQPPTEVQQLKDNLGDLGVRF